MNDFRSLTQYGGRGVNPGTLGAQPNLSTNLLNLPVSSLDQNAPFTLGSYQGEVPGTPGAFNGAVNSNVPNVQVPNGGLSTGQKFSLGVGTANALINSYLGFKQLGIAKDQLAFSKDAFERNYGAQKQTHNTSLENRYRTAQASSPGSLKESLESYVDRNGIK